MEENKPFANDRIDYMVNLADVKKSDKVLNVGISNIPEIEMILENKVKECWTVDLDQEKLDKASKFLKKTRLIVGDVTKSNQKLKTNYFDKIIICEVFEHLKDDHATAKYLNTLLKKGGKIIISVPNNHPIHVINPVKYTQHERHYSREMLTELLKKNGFKINHFNSVESWRLLANLYVHLFFKYVLRKNVKFGVFTRNGDESYNKYNKTGLDFVVSAIKE